MVDILSYHLAKSPVAFKADSNLVIKCRDMAIEMWDPSRYATIESLMAGHREVQSHGVGLITSKPEMSFAVVFSVVSQLLESRDARQDGISLLG